MGTEKELLAAIVRAPDDDAPRLVYADWLQERGDPRGELIQLQCEAARLPIADPRRRKIRIRENQLLEAHADDWKAPLKGLPVSELAYERGFIESCVINGGTAASVAALAERVPTLRSVRMLGDRRLVKDLLASSLSLRNLTVPQSYVGAPLSPEAMARTIAEAPGAASLRVLSLSHQVFDAAALRVLCKSPHLVGLEELDLSNNPLGAEGGTVLAEASFTGVRALLLWRTGLDVAGVRSLAASQKLTRVVTLHVGWNQLGEEGVAALADSPLSASVEDLDLRNCRINARALARALALPRLRSLCVMSNSFGPAGVRTLAAAKLPPQLTVLDLSDNRIGDEGAASLACCAGLVNLTELNLRSCKITDEGVAVLAKSPHLTGLRNLNLNNNRITERGKKLLVDSKSLTAARLFVGATALKRS
jgi:uncharacterized protein (TIGR02996 family)